ncbi:MAG: alkaline phosphatase [Chloroflexota bacterium]|nr:MAG: alkaline phosphatase [Chloroflexota bacterium]
MAAVSVSPTAASDKPVAKNIIVLIADGRGYNHVEAANYYAYGKEARQVYQRFPFRFAMSTYMADTAETGYGYCGHGYDPVFAWSDFEYVNMCYTDSAAAATTMSTGVKTFKGSIGMDLDEQPLLHMLEIAEANGQSTGVVTSVEWTHATPAGYVAHNVSRNNYAEIGQEMVYDSAADVVMGAGHPWYDADGQPKDTPNTFKYVGGEDTWNDLIAGTAGGDADGDGVDDPWLLIQTRAEFQALMSGPTPKRVLGTAQVYQTLQSNRSGDEFADPYVVPLIETVPTLEEMTKAALNILDDDPDGLFLMIEGGAVDWTSHGNNSGRMIEEHVDFDMAVQAAVDWVKANSNWGETLVIVTSDHETGYLTGPGSDPGWTPIINNGLGNLPGMEWHSGDHTNSLVPFYAKGDAGRYFTQSADEYDPAYGWYLDNTEMASGITWAMEP